MTKRNLNNNELEIITGGATEIAEDGSGPATSKAEAPMTGSGGSYSSNSGLDTEVFGQDNDL